MFIDEEQVDADTVDSQHFGLCLPVYLEIDIWKLILSIAQKLSQSKIQESFYFYVSKQAVEPIPASEATLLLH